MKRRYSFFVSLFTILLSVLLSVQSFVLAASIWDSMESMICPFSGWGEIQSFYINESGDILICVKEWFSSNRYIMVFNTQGNMSHAFQIKMNSYIYGKIENDKTIILFLQKSALAWKFDLKGHLVEESTYEAEGGSKIMFQDCYSYKGISFCRNSLRTKITKIENGEEKVFYEIKGGRSLTFVVSWMGFTWIALIAFFLCYKTKKQT